MNILIRSTYVLKSCTLVSIFLFTCLSGISQIKLAEIFSDHMVIQRSEAINIWGKAETGSIVEVTFLGKSEQATADNNGKWMITFDPAQAGGPHNLKVVSGNESIVLKDVYIGDVWLCSGQSNMEWIIANSQKVEETVRGARDEMIRHIKIPHSYAENPEDELVECHWEVNSPETVSDFTAVGYYFAQSLRAHHDVPIGLLNSSWGGSRIEAWMSPEALSVKDAVSAINEMKEKAMKAARIQQKRLNSMFPGLDTEDKGMKGNHALWADPSYNDSEWKYLSIPQLWEQQGMEGFDGIGWYRIEVQLTANEAGNDALLGLSKIDDSDKVWVNGHFVGGVNQAWDKTREYLVLKDALVTGRNVIAIRVEDTGGGGGIYGPEEELYLETSDKKISLVGKHKFKAGAILTLNPVSNAHHTPTLLYNKMIFPLQSFSIKGVIWYQGESNAGNENDALAYKDQFIGMVEDWRKIWKQPSMPFMFVQLANFMTPDEQPEDSFWAILRESQHATLEVENIGEAVIIDLGEADDIHPRNKHDVGYRLSLPARKWAYNEDINYAGPEYVSHRIEGQKIKIVFDQKIEVKNKYGYVNGFAVAGKDGEFKWANASANGNEVAIWSSEVVDPLYVRYGWGNNPDDLNIYNKEGLPASPFRTDKLRFKE